MSGVEKFFVGRGSCTGIHKLKVMSGAGFIPKTMKTIGSFPEKLHLLVRNKKGAKKTLQLFVCCRGKAPKGTLRRKVQNGSLA